MKPFYHVIDNFFEENIQNYIENLVISQNFPWFYRPYMLNGAKKDNHPWMSHPLIFNGENISPYTSNILDFFISKKNKIENEINLSIDISYPHRMNLNFSYEKFKFGVFRRCPWHTDSNKNHVVILYYVNNSEGPTELKNITKVFPKKGRLLIFDGKIEHRAHLSSKNNRFVLNFNYLYE